MTAPIPSARVLHVAVSGDDSNNGSEQAPWRRINTAAQKARPGDTIRVHAGTYRESIDPLRGGDSDQQRITYEAAEGEQVEILGSEIVTGWERESEAGSGIWKAVVPNARFGDYNPFAQPIAGDWFIPMGRPHHTGSVFFNGVELREAATPESLTSSREKFWHAQVGSTGTIIRIHCGQEDPNEATVEILARPTVFYPRRTGVNFITVRGFTLRHAATNWAPPTAEQVGLIGTNWSKGWIIEHNTISHSRCVGISLGKHGDAHDNTSQDSAEGYVETVKRALDRGWHRDHIGAHIVRHNTVSHCGQAGIVGSLGAVFSQITDNEIHHIHRGYHGNLFSGAEQAGIKLHAPIDTLIARNHIHHTNRALWMDWMTQGTRIARNLCHDNAEEDLFIEVNHGPFIIDHNLFLSDTAILDVSQGGAFVHNLIYGRIKRQPEPYRETPYHPQSSTAIAGLDSIRGGDERYINNLFLNGNAFEEAARETNPSHLDRPGTPSPFPNILSHNQIVTSAFILKAAEDGWYLDFKANGTQFHPCPRASTGQMGTTQVSKLPYLSPAAEPFVFESDYLGVEHPEHDTLPGPFAADSLSERIKVFGRGPTSPAARK